MTDKLLPANRLPLQPTRDQLIEAVAEWKATPEVYRQERTLNQLAQRLGVQANGWFYELADSAEVYHLMLVKVAGEALEKAPDILQVLAERALAGNIRAAEVYLDFVRKIITDSHLIEAFQARPVQVKELIEGVEQSAACLLQVAQALGDDEQEARRKLEADLVRVEEIGSRKGT